MQEWKMRYGQKCKCRKYGSGQIGSRSQGVENAGVDYSRAWKAEPILGLYSDTALSTSLKLSLDFWVNKGRFLLHLKIVAAFFYFCSGSLLDADFLMWRKVVVNIKCTGFKRYLNADL